MQDRLIIPLYNKSKMVRTSTCSSEEAAGFVVCPGRLEVVHTMMTLVS